MPRPGKTILVERGATCNASTGPTSRVLVNTGGVPLPPASANMATGMFYLEPDDYIGTKLRVRLSTLVNATAPVADYTVGLYPVTAIAGTVGIVTGTVSATPVTGSLLTVLAPAANSMTRSETPEFDWPVAGWYVFNTSFSANATANSATQFIATLEAR